MRNAQPLMSRARGSRYGTPLAERNSTVLNRRYYKTVTEYGLVGRLTAPHSPNGVLQFWMIKLVTSG